MAFLDSIKSFFSGDDTGTQTSTPAVAPALEQDNIQSVIDTATAPKEDVVFGLPKFEPKPQPNQTPVPADNLDKDAVDVSEVESAIRDSVAPETGAGFGTAERTTALADEPVEDVPTTPEAPSIRDQIQEGILSALGQDTTAEKARLREEAGIEEKANTSNRILNQLRTMRVDFESKKDDLENTNEAGRSMGSINNEINKLTKDTNRNLAYKSIEFDIANNDLQSAEATVNNRIQDMKDEQTKQVNLYKTLFDFVQDDMSESEQLQANQAFAEKQAQQSFENQKELADYSSLLRKDEAMFTQNLKNAVTAQEAEQASKALVPSLQEKVGQIDEAIADLASGSANVVGANVLARFSLLKPFGAGANFIANIEKFTSQETLDTLVALKQAGGTLGALNTEELNMLQRASTRINDWKIEKDGKVVGYKVSEKDFDTELKTLKALTNKAIINAGGSIDSDPLGLGIGSDPLSLGI